MKKDKVIALIKKHLRGNCLLSGDEMQTACPFCEEKRYKFSFNLKKEAGHCWICERAVWGIEYYLFRVIGIDLKRAKTLTETDADAVDAWSHAKQEILRKLVGVKKCTPMPRCAPMIDGSISVVKNQSMQLSREILNYLSGRKFNKSTIKLLDPHVSNIYPNWFTLPVYMNGEMVYWVRRYMFKGEPKYLGPASEDRSGNFYWSKGGVLWGYDLIARGGPCVVCEGVLSAATVVQAGMPSVALFGKTLSNAQRSLLVDKKPGIIYVMLDGRTPEDNTVEKAHEVYDKLINFVNKVEIVELPEGVDPNNLGDKVLEMLQ